MPSPPPPPLDVCLDAIQERPKIPARVRLANALRVPKPTPDQVAYLRQVQASVTGFDPDAALRGRRPEDLGTSGRR